MIAMTEQQPPTARPDTTGELKIETVPIDSIELAPEDENCRIHGDLEPLKASLTEYGQQVPLLVDEDGIIRKGNRTYKAMISLGWKRAQIIRHRYGDRNVARWYALVDNKLAEQSKWDKRRMSRLIQQQHELFSAGLAQPLLGFTQEEVDAHLSYDSEGGYYDVTAMGGAATGDSDRDKSHIIYITFRNRADFLAILTVLTGGARGRDSNEQRQAAIEGEDYAERWFAALGPPDAPRGEDEGEEVVQ